MARLAKRHSGRTAVGGGDAETARHTKRKAEGNLIVEGVRPPPVLNTKAHDTVP